MDNRVSTIQKWMDSGGKAVVDHMRPVQGMQHNALLRKDEWLELDTAVLETVKTSLVGIEDLIGAGLTRPLGGLGTLLSGYEQLGDMTEADVSMDADVPGEEDVTEFDTQYVPVPIIHKDFRISLRKLEASRKMGETLDVTQARAATRVVREKIEDMLFNGHAKQLGGYTIKGYTNATYRMTGTAVGDFGTAGNGYKTMVKALNQAAALGYNGPFNVYIATTQYGELLNLLGSVNDYNELTVISRQLPEIASVKRCFNLTAGQLVMVQMNSETVDLAVAEDIAPVQWDEMGGMLTKFRVMAALVPRVKFDANNHTGILHYTGA